MWSYADVYLILDRSFKPAPEFTADTSFRKFEIPEFYTDLALCSAAVEYGSILSAFGTARFPQDKFVSVDVPAPYLMRVSGVAVHFEYLCVRE